MTIYPRISIILLSLFLWPAVFFGSTDARSCWPVNISQEPAVGFDLTLGYGTSVALFPNGSFSNIAFVQGSDTYKAWMDLALDEAATALHRKDIRLRSWGARVWSTVETHVSEPSSIMKALIYIRRIYFRSRYEAVPRHIALLDVSSLSDLISMIKKETESKLGFTLSKIAISYPDFFDSSLISRLSEALRSASLSDEGCHGDGRSSVASLIAHRQIQTNPDCPQRFLDCIHGERGLENVVHIENTEEALSITRFNFFAEEHTTWAEVGLRRPRYLKKLSAYVKHQPGIFLKKDSNPAAVQKSRFWAAAQAAFDDFFSAQWDSREDTVYRLILTGSQSHDPVLLQALQETQGVLEMRPQFSPVTLRVQCDKGEISRKYGREFGWRTCPPGEPAYTYGDLWGDYGQSLLIAMSREPPVFNSSLEPRFLAARGAALYSLESRLSHCVDRCDMASCPEKQTSVDLEDFGRDWYQRRDLHQFVGLGH